MAVDRKIVAKVVLAAALKEAKITPSSDKPIAYMKRVLDFFEGVANRASEFKDRLDRIDKEEYYDILESYVSRYRFEQFLEAISFQDRINYWDWESVKSALELVIENHPDTFNARNRTQFFYDYVVKEAIKRIDAGYSKLRGLMGDFNGLQEQLDRWGSTLKEESYGYEESDLPDLVDEVLDFAEEVLHKVARIQDGVNAIYSKRLSDLSKYYNNSKEAPYRRAEELEKLYHASVSARKIYQNGFSDKPPGEHGIGGSSGIGHDVDGAISFTASLRTAQDIARALKEAVMIAHGQLDERDIMSWALHDGGEELWDTVKGSARSVHGFDVNKGSDDLRDIFNLYRSYLAHSPKREDPLFMNSYGIMELFGKVNYKDVGIIEALVDVDTEPVQYLSSMHEYRVLPTAVKKITKLIQ